MHLSDLPTALLATASILHLTTAQTTYPPSSSKRGLAYVKPDDDAADNAFWTDSSLTWYYNWQATPSSQLSSSSLQFVPMLWGSANSNGFHDTVKSQLDSGKNITHVLGFNEPDGCHGVEGGSCLDAQTAAKIWIREMEPLKELGVKLGAPAVTSAPTGFNWLANWFSACDGQCNPDFIPVHYYGDFQGFASHIGQVNATYGNMTMWVTEWAFPKSKNLEGSQEFFNQSVAFVERVPYIDRYSYFGAFRSSASNVGKNAAMLTQKGQLTDIGAWYLGKAATGNIPKGDAVRTTRFAGSVGLVIAVGLWCVG
ncbi:unnamed protein product [Zymoseptoria tritici ST99CH_3D1]|uniref:Asl1-like glycosyl hydrolase catalytic domain-containing protein n=2 Tax=Zymoseptoria tritici TaxID=1047171 RepID=A0A1X7RWE7_ZYMT9|nr:unnamed protein product [Zymoseptoria tritici ST99CH_3D7]SMR56196.1 unnamed protein product [Zymoseptoria tritici ST99CH_3D1]